MGSEPHSQPFRLPLKLFATPAAPQRLDGHVHGYIVRLQPPNSALEVPVYNSTSTSMSTVSGPGPFFTDVRPL